MTQHRKMFLSLGGSLFAIGMFAVAKAPSGLLIVSGGICAILGSFLIFVGIFLD